MSLEKIVSIPGMSGLYKVIAQMRNGGYVVESLTDQKRLPIDAMHRVVKLDDISVYTVEGEMPLREVFLKMKEHDADASKLSAKSEPGELKSALKKFVPNYDEDRVHVSDMRKMISWYSVLKDIVDFKESEKEEKTSTLEEDEAEQNEPAKSKAKTSKAKKTSAEKDEEAKPSARKKTSKKSAS